MAIKNRRHEPDTMVKLITTFNVLSWLVIGVVLVLYAMVNPIRASDYFNRSSAPGGGVAMLSAKLLLFLNIVVSLWGMAVNAMRNKRRSDKFRISLILSALISIAAFVLMMIYM